MAIDVKIGAAATEKQAEPAEEKRPVQAELKLNIKKMLNGGLAIFDHPEIDVVIDPAKSKIVAFAKDEMGDHIYATQSRLFEFLMKKGVIEPESIQGGNVYGTLEAKIPIVEAEGIDPIQVSIFTISKFINEEQPYYRRDKEYEEEFERWLHEPDEEESTELGEVPHEQRKGVQNRWPGSNVAFGLTGMYRA